MKLQQSWKNLLKKWQEQNKKSFKKSLFELWGKQSNSAKVLYAAILSAIIFLLIYCPAIKNHGDKSAGYWNFIILIVSSPVAFVIWHFRDENNRQQVENQRKDINLKEFQKLSEWVSGAHLPEIKIVEKNITKSSFTTDDESATSPKKQITEQTEERSKEYGQKPDTTHSNTFGKWDGAAALQISAIYNLLPFFRGDYGESFRLPAFNLLKSAWQAMQQDELNKLNELRLQERKNAYFIRNAYFISRKPYFSIKQEKEKQEKDILIKRKNLIIRNLRKKARSPMGVALTYVLLSPNRENTKLNLEDFPEMKPNLCLAGMDFSFNYQKANSSITVNLSGTDLSGTDLSGADLSGAILTSADLFRANLSGADLSRANLSGAILARADLSGANLSRVYSSDASLFNANLSHANLSGACLLYAYLSHANLYMVTLSDTKLYNCDLRYCRSLPENLLGNTILLDTKINAFDFDTKFYPYWKHPNDPEWKNLTELERKETMQKFCNKTGMIIVDNNKNEVAKPES